MAYTVFTTYILAPTGITGYGYSQAIHCNYINPVLLNTDTPEIMELNMSFPKIEEFKFLSNNGNLTGFTVNKIYMLLQIVAGTTNVKPLPDKWKIYDLTGQIENHVIGAPLTASGLTQQSFIVKLNKYYDTPSPTNPFIPYDLSYLNYPSRQSTDDDKLCFGDEVYFMGNVNTDIHADVYTTDLSIVLPLNQFNSSTNPTWKNSGLPVTISEIGVYDANKILVGTLKINDPIDKNSQISRTILFALDF